MRFWGKIFGTKKDYYIAEGIIDNSLRLTVSETAENYGVGCNRLTFWASNESNILYKLLY